MIGNNLVNAANTGSYSNYVYTTELWGFGKTSNGQLNNNVSSGIFQEVEPNSSWASASAGNSHTMSVKTDGTLWGWGVNGFGQIGDGTSINRSSPVQIGTQTDWSSVVAGNNYTIAEKTNGTLWAWGNNTTGQLGTGNTISYSSPVQVGTLSNWSQISIGSNFVSSHTMAIKTDGTLWGWGSNSVGQLGLNISGTEFNLETADQDWLKGSISGTSSGGRIHIIKTNGRLWTWGDNGSGVLGDGTFTTRSSPVQIGTRSWNEISSLNNHVVAVRNDGTLWAWGLNNSGVLGTNNTTSYQSPVQVGTLSNWSQVSAGNSHTMSVKTDGTLWAWGNNSWGQLGDGTFTIKSSPVQIGTLTNWSKVSMSSIDASIAIKTDGTLWSWGRGNTGILGLNSRSDQSSPVQIGTRSWSSVSMGQFHAMAIRTDGTLWGWGQPSSGEIGNNSQYDSYSSPIQIGTLNNWSKVFAGKSYTMAIKTDGTLWGWGNNSVGQLGTGNTTSYSSPVQIGTRTNWSDILVSRLDSPLTLAINTSNELYSTGGATYFLRTVNYSSPVQIGTLNNWSKIYIESYQGTAVKTDGTLWTWGLNGSGQLGDNTTVSRISPIQIGVSNDWASVYSGGSHTMAIKTTGTLWSWGENSYGQLGLNDSFINRSSPVQVGTRLWTSVGLGTNDWGAISSAIRNDNTLWLWGISVTSLFENNTSNQTQRSSPVQIGTFGSWSQVAFNGIVIFGIDTNNKLYANALETTAGLGVSFNYKSTTQIGNKTNWTDISAGASYTMAISGSGTIWGWGDNTNGQLGTGNTTSRNSPVQIGTLSLWKSVKLGSATSFAIRTQGTLWAWGENSYGQLGLNDSTHRSSPVQVGVFVDWKSVSIGSEDSVAGIRNNNTLWTWGNDANGVLGQTTNYSNKSVPTQVGTLANWASVSVGRYHALATKTDGTLWSWGYNTFGQLGDATSTDKSSPVQIGTDTNWSSISAGNDKSFASKTNGTIWAWGYAGDNLLGLHKDGYIPNKVSTDSFYKDVSASGNGGIVAIKTNGTLWGWGSNSRGEIGDGSTSQRNSPVQIGTLSNWSDVSAGSSHTMSIKTDGTLWAWGNNGAGRLGTNNTTNFSSPVQVGTLTNWSKISSGFSHTMSIKTDGTLWAWGYNLNGQLGTGNTISYSSPVQVGTLNNWSQVSAGFDYTIGIRTDGTLWAWGNNSYRALGTNNATSYSSPVQVGTLSNWSYVSAENFHTMAVKTDGTLWVWGENSNGQLGTGNTISYSSPVQVGTLNNWSKVYGSRVSFNSVSVAIKTDGTVWAWGSNSYRFGSNTTAPRSSPVQVGTLNTFVSASFGNNVATGITSNGTLYSWGLQHLGYDTNFSVNRSTPTQIGEDTDWNDSIIFDNSTGQNENFNTTLVIKNNGTLWGWGQNQSFQLGLGDNFNRSFPVQIASAYNWVSGSIGTFHTTLIRKY
jgi:alpha-tubulin suppressor-like RCC1 family protein